MNKKTFNPTFLTALSFTCLIIASCAKKDLNPKSEQVHQQPKQEQIIGEIKSAKISNPAPLNFKAIKATKKIDKEKLLSDTFSIKKAATASSLTTQTIGCYSMGLNEYYGEYGSYYNYPILNLNFDNSIGSVVTVTVHSYGTPNQFTLLNPNGNIIAQSGWLGSASYDGPWGSELSTGSWSGEFTFTTTMAGNYMVQVETVVNDQSDYWEVQTNCQTQGVSANGNRLKFGTISSYEQFADEEQDQGLITNLANSTSAVTTLEESGYADPGDLYPDFIKQIINQDRIVEIGSFLLKFDLENDRVLAIRSWEPNAYSKLVANQLSANGMMNFHGDVSNGVEILTAIESGTLNPSNYQAAIEVTTAFNTPRMESIEMLAYEDIGFQRIGKGGGYLPTVKNTVTRNTAAPFFGCRHAGRDVDTEKNPNGFLWDVKTGNSGCSDNSLPYYLEPKIVYQKAVFYFSLQSKVRSWMIPTCNDGKDDHSYDCHLKIEGTAKYIRRCGSERIVSSGSNRTADNSETKWRAWGSGRSLQRYDFQVYFSAKHYGSTAPYAISRLYRIVDGY